jgi:hypothetical protein
MTEFQINDPSIESQWRALILFGKNSATYKFAFAKSLSELIEKETTSITLFDLAKPFSRNITEHLKQSDKKGNSSSSKFLNYFRDFNEAELLTQTEKLGFVNVVDAFQNVNGGQIPNLFYQKDYSERNKKIIVTDDLLKLKESFHFQNFEQEAEARWKLVETAWNLQINPNLLEVKYDEASSLFFIENEFMRRIDITSVRGSLNGYQKGKCFCSFLDISIIQGSSEICHVDHFLSHMNKQEHSENGANINGVWNLVLAHSSMNSTKEKGAKVPNIKYLDRLFNRNEFYINSKHPLAETIVKQTGNTKYKRKTFLEKQYNIALDNSIVTWIPSEELEGTF